MRKELFECKNSKEIKYLFIEAIEDDIRKFYGILNTFLIRDNGFSREDALSETSHIGKNISYKKLLKDPSLYLKIPRIGLKKLSNKERRGVLSSIENAFNHSLFNR